MKRSFLAVAGLLVIALAFVLIKRASSARQSDNDLQIGDTVRVTRRDVGSMVKAIGLIKPMVGAEVRVGSIASGVVSRLSVKIGDKVEKGALLAEVDSREFVTRREAAEAAVRQASASLNYALTDLRRKQSLYDAQVLARSELDLAQQAYDVADEQYKQAKANLATAMTQLGYTNIVAPIAGTVESISTQEGETVASNFNAPTFVTLLDLSRLEVWAYVDETDIGRIHAGQNASFTVDTYGDYEFNGRITTIYPQAQIRDNVVDYVAVVRFEPPRDRILRPEMTASIKIAIDQRKNVLALPIRALRREGKRQFVMIKTGNSVARRWITTGIRDDSYSEITSGLQENDVVLVGGSDKH